MSDYTRAKRQAAWRARDKAKRQQDKAAGIAWVTVRVPEEDQTRLEAYAAELLAAKEMRDQESKVD